MQLQVPRLGIRESEKPSRWRTPSFPESKAGKSPWATDQCNLQSKFQASQSFLVRPCLKNIGSACDAVTPSAGRIWLSWLTRSLFFLPHCLVCIPHKAA